MFEDQSEMPVCNSMLLPCPPDYPHESNLSCTFPRGFNLVFRLPPPQFDVQRWAFQKDLFTPEECQQLVDYAKSKESINGIIGGRGVVPDVRSSDVVWIEQSQPEVAPLFQKLAFSISNVNWKHFRATLYDQLFELAQVGVYRPNQKYDAHTDRGGAGFNKYPTRKLGATVLLSDQFEGGEFFVQYTREETIVELSLGTMVLFPSTLVHGVKPVRSGTRYSLVQWVSGPTWK